MPKSTAKTFTRGDLAAAVALDFQMPQADSARLLDAMVEEIAATLVCGDAVKLSRFGMFVVRAKRERVGRNPKTGVEAVISSRRVVAFRPSKILKRRMSNLEA